MTKAETTPVQRAWEGLANTMRLYVESSLRFRELLAIDKEEAVKNIDMAMEAKLEKFHALYDLTKGDKPFDYFGHGDTSLLIVMRNAIHHHHDHSLFESWNARIGLNDGFKQLSGAEFLLGSTTPEYDVITRRNYYRLDDFYERLKHSSVKNPNRIRAMWDAELKFAAIARAGVVGRYPANQVYVDVMPSFIGAVRRVRGWLAATGFTPAGADGNTYFRSFSEPAMVQELGYKRLRMP
ncbi:hypothetical protein D7Y27_31725 [Corallococcus sp. AB004]|nr:hypothetical protein D7Y27_31725 [Corallococcus sp. AB004]